MAIYADGALGNGMILADGASRAVMGRCYRPMMSSRGVVLGLASVVTVLTSCVESKTYDPPPPGPPRLRLPRNDAYEGSVITRSLRPRFVWDPPSTDQSPLRYELQYAADPSFGAEVMTVETSEPVFQPETNLAVSMIPPVGRRYYWRVRSCVELRCSDYSRPWWVNLGRSDKDYNGDGYADVVVGAPNNDDNGIRDAGKVYVYFGGPGNLFDTVPDGPFGIAGAAADDRFGASASSAGDFNGDGYADIVVGAWGNDAGGAFAGRAYVFFGGPGRELDATADAIFTGSAARYFFGTSVSGAGDVNGDGFSDVIVGAPSADAGGVEAGRAFVFHGGKSGPYDVADGQMTGQVEDKLGERVSGVGDLNGDGFADVATSLPASSGSRVYVYLGRSGQRTEGMADLVLSGNLVADRIAPEIAAGDFDADGFSDLVVGIPATNTPGEAGRISIYRGGDVPDTIPDVVSMGTTVRDKLGFAVAIGDVNGDGHDDLVAGSQLIDGTGNSHSRADIYPGRTEGLLSLISVASLTGRAANDFFFQSGGSGGDVNGDGLDDIIVGAPSDGSSGILAGRAYVFLGHATGAVSNTAAGVLDAGVAESFFGRSAL